ncbi:MAG: 4-hydroxy-tetrahydrodipicolinate reductase [Lewinellaceae bacterium]|nr:4-hydroxy-tetrahydrodipicolinate reductase [Saprospiraceae bacterium]MCB9337256.1 4-hydroxy-tetrahydrodipicolinate reductase [Lewinellaceae bacterium]
MKIALIGYGKMGKAIERLALAGGHEVVLKIGSGNKSELTVENLKLADVAIEFSRPETAFDNITLCAKAGIPVVCGTTAWLDRLEEAKGLVQANDSAFLYASNFSIGVNIFFALNRYLAVLMEQQPQYDVQMEETHHTQKLDAPSGTAITLANDILKNVARKNNWVKEKANAPTELPIASKRVDNVPGTHIVTWASGIDTIEISHTAHSREGFAAGALAAAEWIVGKQGCFEMEDMLGF